MKMRYTLGSVLLYLFASFFICFLSFKKITSPAIWNALYWLILVYACLNAVSKSFLNDNQQRRFFYYTIASPHSYVFAKAFYNALYCVAISWLGYLMYSIFIGNLVNDTLYFFLAITFGSSAFGILLTIVSAITSKAGNNLGLMAVLSFPLIIPLLITLIKLSKNAVDGLERSISNPLLIIVIAIQALIVALIYVLFPFVWKE